MILFYFSMASPLPLILCLALITYAISARALVMNLVSSWVAYAIILIFLGGIMVVFLYVRTWRRNQKFLLPPFPLPLILFFLCAIFYLNPTTPPLRPYSAAYISTIYISTSGGIILFLVVYLLLTLFLVVKTSESFKGALIKKW